MLFPSPEISQRLRALATAEITQPASLAQLLRRPELSYDTVCALAADSSDRRPLPPEAVLQVEVSVKYAGYVKRQEDAVDRFRRLEATPIPTDIDYDAVNGLSREAREKLSRVRPLSLGQAARVPGVTPAALSVLSVHLKRYAACRYAAS